MSGEELSTFSVCDFAAGWASGVCGLLVGHPLDTIKVRLQILGKTSVFKIAASTLKHEGILGFYKGMMFPLLTAGTLNSVFFGVYGNTLRAIQDARQQPVGRTLCCEGGPVYPGYHWDVYYAGCAGGAATVLLSTPIELVKTQLQSQVGDKNLKGARVHLKEYTGPWECLKDLYKGNGIRGCFRGLVPMLWRDIVASGIYMSIYSHGLHSIFESKTTLTVMMSGGLAGFISWATVVPVDVVKSRIQADCRTNPKYKGMIDCFIKSYRAEGIGVFFRGFTITMIRALPVNAATFVGYELFISMCQQHKQNL